MLNFKFISPLYLLLLLPLIGVLLSLISSTKATLVISSINNLKQKKTHFIIIFLYFVSLVLMIFALARPVLSKTVKKLNIATNVDLCCLIDVSDSMSYYDSNILYPIQKRKELVKKGVLLSRITRAKKELGLFVNNREFDHYSLVVFARNALTLSSLTSDKKYIIDKINKINSEMLDLYSSSTNLKEGLLTSINTLKHSKNKKVIILFSDGKEDVKTNIDIDKVMELIHDYNIKVFTLDISDKYTFDASFKLRENTSDKDFLQKLSSDSGGKYYKVESSDFKQVFNEIAKENTIKNEVEEVVEVEYFYYIIVLSFIIFILAFILQKTKYLTLP